MKQQKINYSEPTPLDITVEEFDAFDGVHEFSREYQQKKKQLVRQYRKSFSTPHRHAYIKAAVAALCCAVGIPVMANAATNGDFFNRIWGNLTKGTVKSHQEQLYDEQDLPFMHTFPERDYVPINPDKAMELIGDCVSHEPIITKLNDTTLTILSYVSDGNAAIVEFTLERTGGVNAFHYSQLENEYHGATFSDDATFWFHFPACSENIYVDLEQSTEELLHCYDYMTMEPDAYDTNTKGIIFETYEYPCTRGMLVAADETAFDQYMGKTKTSRLTVPLYTQAKQVEYTNPDGGVTAISPIAMKIDTDTGLGLAEANQELYDPNNIYYVSVNDKDGTKYLVLEHNLQDQHTCETEFDNSSCISYDTQGNLIIVFNRLVDTEAITSITVNEVTYEKN